MERYLCKEKGVCGEHDCASVEFVGGCQVCGAVQFQIDYAGHVFCAFIAGKKEIDKDQISLFEVERDESNS